MKMSVMRYDGLQGQPFWMQNDQLANSSQYCLKTSTRVDPDRRKVQRSLRGLDEDHLGPSRIMQMDDSVTFSKDLMKEDLKGTKSSKRRKTSSDVSARQKLLRISELDAENNHLGLSSSDGEDSRSRSEDEDALLFGPSRMTMLTSGEVQQSDGRGGDASNNCDINEDDDELEMETGHEDKNFDLDDEGNLEEDHRMDEIPRNNGDGLNLNYESNDSEDEFEPEESFIKNEKNMNSEDDSDSLNCKNEPVEKQMELSSMVVVERRASLSNSLARLNQAAIDGKTASNNVTVATGSSESRRNKRKNFKPRNIVYQCDMSEDADNELIDDYLSNWDLASQQQKNLSRDSPGLMGFGEDGENPLGMRRSPSATELPLLTSKSSPRRSGDEDDGGGDLEKPLDLSDSASLVEQSKQENKSIITAKHLNRKKSGRRYPEPLEMKGPSRFKQLETGSPMDLTTASRNDDESTSTSLCNKMNSSDLSDAMDLSKGQISSAYNALPNYATSLTSVPALSELNSSLAANSESGIAILNNAAGLYEKLTGNCALNSLPKIAPAALRTGISASLLDLVNAGSTSSPSKRNAKAAAAAAAAHAAAISLAQAVRDREDGNAESNGGGAMGLLGPAGIMGSLPPNMDASSMKDYAESTMKELLGLYGLNDMAESLSKDAQITNFLSADILESMSNTLGLLPTSRASLLPSFFPRSVPSSSPQSSASRCPSPSFSLVKSMQSAGRTGHLNSATTTPSPTDNAPSTSSQLQANEEMYESFHSQVGGSMAKLANLPSGNVVGNPRAILPPNINSMLTSIHLAAMQKKQAEVPSTSSSPTLSSVTKTSAASTSHRARNSSSGMSSGIYQQDNRKSAPIDYSRYVKRYVKMRLLRFPSSADCGNNSCKDLNYREHFHCVDCNSRVFIKKEEMIRHFKWHKKRDESLQHGFLRYSPTDDCSEKFPNCAHNRKQTHYHCLMYKEGCDKCYISTSDVQMHANYHRKDSAIIQEGFQRYRATEDCGLSICAFSGQRTTHFHCRRPNCNFTFKNKADMEKHKTYHIKDEQLNKDGFKKFMKHECCNFENCKFSRVCNHIHCIRPGCNYVLHSSGQLYSHKRKHERRDNEMAYRKFKLAQSMMRSLGENQSLSMQSVGDELKHGDSLPPQISSPGPSVCSPSSSSGLPSSGLPLSASGFSAESAYNDVLQQSFSKYSAMLEASGNVPLDSPMVPYGMVPGADPFSLLELSADFLKGRSDDSWRKYLSRFTANDLCKSSCDFVYKDHYHCNAENCSMVFRSKEGVREHAKNHELQDQVTDAFYTTIDGGLPGCCPADCPYQNKQRHYHCGWQNCREIILSVDKPFRRLDHYKIHEYSHKLSFSKEPVPLNITSCSSIDGIFRRKRGRPPKNRTVEFPVTSGSSEYPQAIYTSFKLPKLNHLPVTMTNDGCMTSPFGNMNATTSPAAPKNSPSPGAHLSPIAAHLNKVDLRDVFHVYPEGSACPLKMCSYYGKLHYHCIQPKCFYATDRPDMIMLHWKEVHESQESDFIEGFTFYDRHVDCQLQNCTHNKQTRHFHCSQPKCNQSFVRYSAMNQHLEMHKTEINTIVKGYRAHDNNHHGNLLSPNRMQTVSPQVKKEQSSPSVCPSSSSRTPSPSNSLKLSNVVKAAGTFYPLSAFPQSFKKKNETRMSIKVEPNYDNTFKDGGTSNQDCHWMKREVSGSPQMSNEWRTLLESHVAYSAERSCGRSTCKYKNRGHVHCTYCNQAVPNLSLLQPHIQKHLGPAMTSTEVSKGPPVDDCSDDEFSDRQMDDDDDDDRDGLTNSQRHPDMSDDSDSSCNRFATNYRHSSPSADSTPSSHNQSYAPFMSNSGTVNDVLQTFPNVADHLQMNPLANFFNASNANLAAGGAAQDFRAHNQSKAVHPNGGNNSHLERNTRETQSSPVSTPPGSGAASSVESYGSNPSSPHLQFANQKHFQVSGGSNLDGGMTPGGGDDMCDSKKVKITGLRLLRDEPVPEGYIRYRFNEDCRYTHCGYREHQTHFHCMRKDCGYSFCDKTRFVQHTARHERLDTLMGGDFQQFRAQVACGRSDCVYITAPGHLANKASHFHCLKCEFVCTDTNKVVAHRRQHQKLDSITAAGFEKYSAQQSCNNEGCSHNQRQTHYHCVKCQYAVMGLSQMSAHKYRHLEG